MMMHNHIAKRSTQRKPSSATGLLQRKGSCGNGGPGGATSAAPAIVHDVIGSSGSPLDRSTRSFMESRFGHDFSRVRVHTDDRAAASARAVSAHAYTVGGDVVFGAGEYRPGTPGGNRLLAHELAHVVQQSSALQRSAEGLAITPASDPSEREADAAADKVMSGGRAGSITAAATGLARACITGPACAPNAAGSAAGTSSTAESDSEFLRRRRARMSPERQGASGHGGHARQLERIMDAELPGLRANIHGIFVDQDFPASSATAYTWDCSLFTPPITGATKPCMFVPAAMNQQAYRYNTTSDATIGGMSREDWRVFVVQTLAHEAQHVVYDTAAHADPAGVAAGCSASDPAIAFELSEISSRIVEFPPVQRAVPAGAVAPDPALARLDAWFTEALTNPHGNIPGSINVLRCRCDCADVTRHIDATFRFSTGSWTVAEKDAFNAEMRTRLGTTATSGWPL